ncbi:HEAT repeat domain-containing protein [Chloroflexota bacterium]
MEDQPNHALSSSEGIDFQELVDALLDHETPFAPRYLYRLSGLEEPELTAFKEAWPQADPARRLALLEDLEELAETNTLVSYDAVFQVALEDPNPDTRTTAIRGLWEAEDPRLVTKFADILQHDDHFQTRAQAAAGLGQFVYLCELSKITDTRLEMVIEALLEVYKNDDAVQVRLRALESLGFSSDQRVSPLLEDAYDRGDEDWLASALLAMGRSCDEQWSPYVMDKLDHSDSHVRREAARAAGELELAPALPALLSLLDDSDDETRMSAAWSLSELGGADARNALAILLEVTEDQAEIDLLEEALDNLAFNQELDTLELFDFSKEDLEDMLPPDEPNKE